MNDVTRALVRLSRATSVAALYVFFGCVLLAGLFLLIVAAIAVVGA